MEKTLHNIGSQSILELNGAESDFLDSCRARIFELVEEAGIEPADDADVFDVCDELIRSWHASSPETRPDANELVNICGVILGDHLCEPFELAWAICKDKDGSDMCIFRKKNDVILFPSHSVAKRFASSPEGFMAELYLSLGDTLANIQ